MKSQEQLNYEFSTRQLLKMVPGGENWYVAGNGRLNQVRPGGAGPRQQPQGVRPQQVPPFRPNVPPPTLQTPAPQPTAAPAPVKQPDQQQQVAALCPQSSIRSVNLPSSNTLKPAKHQYSLLSKNTLKPAKHHEKHILPAQIFY